jgi:hypothetical protein
MVNMVMLSGDFRAALEPELHCGISLNRHLVDYGKPQLFVKVVDSEWAVLDVRNRQIVAPMK